MKTKQRILLVFVGVCAILIAVTVVTALDEAELASSGEAGQLFSVSIAVTPTLTFDPSDLPIEPDMPAQFDEGADEPTREPDPPAQFDEGADEPTPAQGN